MNISAKDWDAYVKTLRLLSDTAANKLQAYINKYGIDNAEAIAEYSHALITKYGEGSAELACQMYDAIGQAEGVILPSAVPAPIPTKDEVERAVLGSFAQSPTGKVTASIADRYVKLAAEDTMARNAIRDRAEWAWVPHGDTCAFCITLASRGWQIASKRILRGGHAEHVHAHCDCQFAIRHDGKSNVSGYDPDKYYQMYKNAEGNSPKEKINSLRREIEEHERVANHVVKYGEEALDVDFEYIKTKAYRNKFKGLTDSAQVNDKICNQARKILTERTSSEMETLTLLDKNTGNLIGRVENSKNTSKIDYNQKIEALITKAKENNKEIFAIHNHPHGWPPTADDCESAGIRGYLTGVAVGHNGEVYEYGPSFKGWSKEDCERYHNDIAYQLQYEETAEGAIKTWIDMMAETGFNVKIRR